VGDCQNQSGTLAGRRRRCGPSSSTSAAPVFNHEGSALIGASNRRTMPGFGLLRPRIGVAIGDSGIDATHPDLP